MKHVRYGVIGIGNMGTPHARSIVADKSRKFSLAAICDTKPEKAAVAQELGVPFFADYRELIDSGLVDAIIIAVPHYWHAPMAVYAAQRGIHVLCEKPLASSVGPARTMIQQCKKHKVRLGVVLHHRSRDIMRKAKQLVENGTLGELFRVSMVCSSWFRSQAYYDSGDWRGTWDGEGGGVLINQAPHHLDLFKWIGGMPNRISAVIDTRQHKIEVEDTANIICQYGDGKIGYIYATTAEVPGMEQFILSGDKGTLVWDGGKLRLAKLKTPLSKYIYTTKSGFKSQDVTWSDLDIKENGGKHIMIIRAFADWVMGGKFPYATGDEALGELEISNAAYISGYKNKAVDLPVDANEMEKLLDTLERQRSTGKGQGIRKAATKALKQHLAGK
jgi:predicted dehydrogenase